MIFNSDGGCVIFYPYFSPDSDLGAVEPISEGGGVPIKLTKFVPISRLESPKSASFWEVNARVSISAYLGCVRP